MKYSIRFLYLVIYFLTFSTEQVWSYTSIPMTQESQLEQEVKSQIPSYGILEQTRDGFVYVKIPDEFVLTIFPYVNEPGFLIPASIRRHTMVGAHISVFYVDEAKRIGHITEIGRRFYFKFEGIQTVRSGRTEYLIVKVYSPELEHLRMKYGLSPKLFGHEFHITIGEREVHSFERAVRRFLKKIYSIYHRSQ